MRVRASTVERRVWQQYGSNAVDGLLPWYSSIPGFASAAPFARSTLAICLLASDIKSDSRMVKPRIISLTIVHVDCALCLQLSQEEIKESSRAYRQSCSIWISSQISGTIAYAGSRHSNMRLCASNIRLGCEKRLKLGLQNSDTNSQLERLRNEPRFKVAV